MANASLPARLARACDGSFAVELALLAPVLILLVGGMLDYGAMTYQSMALQSAARSAAEYLRTHPSDVAGANAVAAEASSLQPQGLVVNAGSACECPGGAAVACANFCAGGALPNLYLAVTVTQDFAPLLPYPWVAGPVVLRGAATLRAR